MAVLKHIASKNADYGKSLEYLMFEHTEKGIPLRDKEGNMRMRDRFILDGINCSPFSYDKECEMLNAQYHKNQKYTDIKSHHYIISFDPEDGKKGRLTAEQAQKLGLEFAGKHFPGHQILVCTHTDGHNKSGNIHVHIIFNSVRKLNVEKAPYMDRDIDCHAGYKHHLTKDYLEYLQTELMNMCRRENLRQVDLLSPAGSRITDKEYRAKQQGQKKLEDLNRRITDAGMKPRNTIFQTQKQFLRNAVAEISAQASSPEEFKNQLKEKYGIIVKDRRGRYSYLHPDRRKYFTDRALGNDFEKEHLAGIFLANSRNKQPAVSFDPDYDYHTDPVAILFVRSDLHLVTDLQKIIRAQQSAAYARKVKLTNLKEMAKTVVYIQEHGYDTEEELHSMKKQISVCSLNRYRASKDAMSGQVRT